MHNTLSSLKVFLFHTENNKNVNYSPVVGSALPKNLFKKITGKDTILMTKRAAQLIITKFVAAKTKGLLLSNSKTSPETTH